MPRACHAGCLIVAPGLALVLVRHASITSWTKRSVLSLLARASQRDGQLFWCRRRERSSRDAGPGPVSRRAVSTRPVAPSLDGASIERCRVERALEADDYAAPDLLAGWFERNLKITANLIRVVDSPEDRVVFLVGSGHLHLVRQFAAESGAFTLESANDYLVARR